MAELLDVTKSIPDTAHEPTTWPDVALYVLSHNGLLWAVLAVIVLLFFKDFAENVRSVGEQFDAWHRRREDRANVAHERTLARERLAAEIRVLEERLSSQIGSQQSRMGRG